MTICMHQVRGPYLKILEAGENSVVLYKIIDNSDNVWKA